MNLTARFALLLVGLLLPREGGGQQCEPAQKPLLEYQLERTAQFLPGETHPHPASSLMPPRKEKGGSVLVEFVVDTAGLPQVESYRTLKMQARSPQDSVALLDSIRVVLPTWRFVPARNGGCVMPQVLQTVVVW